MAFLLLCKPDSHKSLYEWLRVLEEAGDMRSVTVRRRNGRFWEIYTYKYANGAPLRDTEDALLVNWVELTITKEDGQILYKNAFVTNHVIFLEPRQMQHAAFCPSSILPLFFFLAVCWRAP